MMKLLLSILFFCTVAPGQVPTECLHMTGYLKNEVKGRVAGQWKLLVDHSGNEIGRGYATRNGSYAVDFCMGMGIGGTIDFYVTGPGTDTLLVAAIQSFEHEVEETGNLFLPHPGAPNGIACPSCKKADALYTLVYKPKEQKNFSPGPARYFCRRDRAKF